MTIKVTYEALHTASSEVTGIKGNLATHLDDLKSSIDRVAAGWDGQAKEDYQAVQNRWNGNASALQDVLTKISSTLEQIAEAYQRTEAKNAGRWGG